MANIVTDLSVNLDFNVRDEVDNSCTFTFTSTNISTYTFSLQVRNFGSPTNVLNLTQGAGLTNGGATTILTVAFTAAMMASLVNDDYYWQLKVVHPDGTTHLWFNGTFHVFDELYEGEISTSVTSTINLAGTDVDVTISLPGGGGGGSSAWGGITGTLSDQTDLQNALNAKLASSAVSAFGLTLIDDATATAARVTLGGVPFVLYKNHTPAALTGSTAETVMDTGLLIGAATLGATDSLRISVVVTKVGANGTLTIRLRCGTLGTTGDLQIATFTSAAGNLYMPFERTITFASLTSQFMYPTTAAALRDNLAVNNSGFTLTIDFSTLANYLMPTFQLSSGADAVTMRHFEVEVIRNS